MHSNISPVAARVRRRANAEASFKRAGICPPGGSLLTLQEAAIELGAPPCKLNDLFRGRNSKTIRLRFDFEEHQLEVGRGTSFPPMISSLSVFTIGKYLRLKEMLRKGDEFAPVGNHFTRYKENLKLINSFVFSHAAKEGGSPSLQLIPDSSKSTVPVHELHGTVYCLPKDAKAIIFCARLTCGAKRSAAMEIKMLRDELASLKHPTDASFELGLKIWFLRERYIYNTTYSCYSKDTQAHIHDLLNSRGMERFFSFTYPRYF